MTLSGSKTDGHRYVAQALEKGAAAILCREPPRTRELALHSRPQGRPGPGVRRLVRIPGGGDDPDRVTGTNGKTTTTYLIKAMLEGR